jgi:hypothetical protein
MPIGLNLLALSIIVFGNWWRLFAHFGDGLGGKQEVINPAGHFAPSPDAALKLAPTTAAMHS